MNGKGFVDTNIFLYAFSDKELVKQKIAEKVVLSDVVTIVNPFRK